MKLLLTVAGVLLIAVFIFADYKWRRWMAARRRERNESSGDLRA